MNPTNLFLPPIELLAPAKDLACGITAIDCGADAVYIGAPRFGAREDAGNPIEAIAELAEYAHRYWARVYVTLNTLLTDDEIPQALRLIEQIHQAGADGLIIQDVGLLECELPPIPLIASTQMHNDTPEKVVFLQNIGLKRAILARELSLDEIGAIHRAAPAIELECFVHGALCVSYSGQCYMSYALGGRSANRGQCAQPCRREYTLLDGEGNPLGRKHWLSIRDLNRSDHLRELIQAGVTSLKIEGRLKDQTYVANVVAHYRQRLDALLPALGRRKSSSGTSTFHFTSELSKTFNRGYTAYFLSGGKEAIGSPETPKMVGERIGVVTQVSARGISIDTRETLHPGDGICFFDRCRTLRGTGINAVWGNVIVPEKAEGIEKGTVIYRNHDHGFLQSLKSQPATRAIAVGFTLRKPAGGLEFAAQDEDGVQVKTLLPGAFDPADKPEAAQRTIQSQLQKCGGTEFRCTAVTNELDPVCFLPISVLNEKRRRTLERLRRARADARLVREESILPNPVPYPVQELSYQGNSLNRWSGQFYRRHGVTQIEPAAESGLALTNRRVMTTKYCLKYQLSACPQEHPADRLPGSLFLIDEDGNRFELIFDCRNCRMEVILRS